MITLEKVLSPMNMLQACKRVKANKGSPGVDGMTVDEIEGHLRRHGASICAHIREGKYIPFPVRRVDIPNVQGLNSLSIIGLYYLSRAKGLST